MNHNPNHLAASLAVQLPLNPKELPTGYNVQLFPEGQFAASDGRPGNIKDCEAKAWLMDATIGPDIIADVDARDARPVVDYEHQSLRARENGQPAPAAGWIQALAYFPGRGLFAKVEWTERARELIKSGEYRYISPVFEFDNKTGTVLRLVNAALTNTPALDGLMAVAASHGFGGRSQEVALTASDCEVARLLGKTEAEFLEDKRRVALADNHVQVAALTASEKEAARMLGMTEAEYLSGKEAL